MKLSKCNIGVMVQDKDLNIGHVIGLTFNVDISQTGDMSNKEKSERTIPLVQFAYKTLGIHHHNIEIFKG